MCYLSVIALHKKWSFPLRISSENVTKYAVSFLYSITNTWATLKMRNCWCMHNFLWCVDKKYINWGNWQTVTINVDKSGNLFLSNLCNLSQILQRQKTIHVFISKFYQFWIASFVRRKSLVGVISESLKIPIGNTEVHLAFIPSFSM